MYGLLKDAIESAIYSMFNGEIPIEDPSETTELVYKHVEQYMNCEED